MAHTVSLRNLDILSVLGTPEMSDRICLKLAEVHQHVFPPYAAEFGLAPNYVQELLTAARQRTFSPQVQQELWEEAERILEGIRAIGDPVITAWKDAGGQGKKPAQFLRCSLVFNLIEAAQVAAGFPHIGQGGLDMKRINYALGSYDSVFHILEDLVGTPAPEDHLEQGMKILEEVLGLQGYALFALLKTIQANPLVEMMLGFKWGAEPESGPDLDVADVGKSLEQVLKNMRESDLQH